MGRRMTAQQFVERLRAEDIPMNARMRAVLTDLAGAPNLELAPGVAVEDDDYIPGPNECLCGNPKARGRDLCVSCGEENDFSTTRRRQFA